MIQKHIDLYKSYMLNKNYKEKNKLVHLEPCWLTHLGHGYVFNSHTQLFSFKKFHVWSKMNCQVLVLRVQHKYQRVWVTLDGTWEVLDPNTESPHWSFFWIRATYRGLDASLLTYPYRCPFIFFNNRFILLSGILHLIVFLQNDFQWLILSF